MVVTNPIMIYSGGKWNLADWIISHFPPHEIYVEPFGGAGSVLLKKPRSKQEIYNDLSERVSNVFRTMRDQGDALTEKLRLTPYSRQELIWATERSGDPIEDARRTIVRAHMSRGRALTDHKGLRYSKTSNRKPEQTWASWIHKTEMFIKRLQGVLIENRDAFDLIDDFDSENTLFYLDPPYLMHTRRAKSRKLYEIEMMDEIKHGELLEQINALKGTVVISGYDCELYNQKLCTWPKFRKRAWTTAHTKADEVLWINRVNQTELKI